MRQVALVVRFPVTDAFADSGDVEFVATLGPHVTAESQTVTKAFQMSRMVVNARRDIR